MSPSTEVTVAPGKHAATDSMSLKAAQVSATPSFTSLEGYISGRIFVAGMLALDAHAKLLVPWSVGWDVAITPQGPMLLEGNPMWGADLAQAPHGEPFDADFAQRLLARLTASAASPPAGL